jgi:hypothetical protein
LECQPGDLLAFESEAQSRREPKARLGGWFSPLPFRLT